MPFPTSLLLSANSYSGLKAQVENHLLIWVKCPGHSALKARTAFLCPDAHRTALKTLITVLISLLNNASWGQLTES